MLAWTPGCGSRGFDPEISCKLVWLVRARAPSGLEEAGAAGRAEGGGEQSALAGAPPWDALPRQAVLGQWGRSGSLQR